MDAKFSVDEGYPSVRFNYGYELLAALLGDFYDTFVDLDRVIDATIKLESGEIEHWEYGANSTCLEMNRKEAMICLSSRPELVLHLELPLIREALQQWKVFISTLPEDDTIERI